MCKSCVHMVQTLLKSLSAVHILCSDLYASAQAPVSKRRLYQYSPQQHTPSLSTHIFLLSDLLMSQLSSLSTVPIIRANK
jgi:hypothetical protein